MKSLVSKTLKMPSRISVCKRKIKSLFFRRHWIHTALVFFSVFIVSCSAKRVDLPNYEGKDLRQFIAERNNIQSVEAVFSVEFERDDITSAGDAAVEMTDNILNMRIYSLGFLVGEIKEKNGIIHSKPEMNRSKSIILVDGLRSSVFWWRIQDYEIREMDGMYELRNSRQRILVDRKTFLPIKQTIELDSGRELRISYEEPLQNGDVWYQSKMRIELSKYVVRLAVKNIVFISR